MPVKFKPNGEILRQFMLDESFVAGIRGPVGSGKSVGCMMKLFMLAAQQEPDAKGKRKTRFAIVRNTNPQLRTTTIKTWLDWFTEEEFGAFRWSVPYTHHIKVGDIDAEFIFLALDREEDVAKLLSLDLTYIFFNEAREIDKAIIDIGTTRVGRFPSMKDGGPSRYGVIMDTNAPEDDHWWPIMAGDVPPPDYITEEERTTLIKPKDWKFYNQPGGMLELKDDAGRVIGYEDNPLAENRDNLVPGYYSKLIAGKRKNWIDVYVLNRLGISEAGLPIYPEFDRQTHVLAKHYEPDKTSELFIGLDYGNTPAATFTQKSSVGEYYTFHEIVTANVKIQMFAKIVSSYMARLKWRGPINIHGDPSGKNLDQQQSTATRLMRAGGVPVQEAETNDPSVRIESVASVLNRNVYGKPAFRISPNCATLVKGFEQGYKYKKMKVSGAGAVYDDKPLKNKYSHPHDALQYAFLGAGEGRSLMMNKNASAGKVHQMKHGANRYGFRGSNIRNRMRR